MENEGLLTMLQQHTQQDDTRFKEVIDGQKEISEDIKVIKENHLAHIQVDMATQTTNIDWLMKFFWLIATASVGALLTGLVTLLLTLHK